MFDVKFVFLWTDAVLWLLVLGLVGYVVYVHRTEELARTWRKVLNNKTAVAAAAVLSVFFAAALADSVHYRRALPATDGAAVAAWDTKTVSLLDALVGEKVAIVSNKAQTTRNRIYGVVNREDTQYILLDTPGLHKPKSALGDYMVKVVTSSLSDVDCALLLVEPIPHVGGPEQALIDRIREENIPCVLCINKIDTVEPAELLPVIAAYNQAWDGFDAIIPISAHTGSGLKDLMKELRKYAQEGPQLFPDGMTTDQPERQVMGEILREKLLLCLDKEIPHGTAVEITKFSERDSGVIDVDATIYCEKASHKGIIIGKQGAMLKKISSLARQDMEKFMGTKVYLETWVKVKENWRDNVNYVRSFGYRDE